MGRIGIIGGSGVYNIEGISDVQSISVSTPFGRPSDTISTGMLEGNLVAFLPRHGKGHRISPSEINYRANVYALKKIGVDRVISVTACGSLREDFKPLDFVVPDQFVDRTNQARKMTFFENGIVAHISFADPVCNEMAAVLRDAARSAGDVHHHGGSGVLYPRGIEPLPEMGYGHYRHDQHVRGEVVQGSGDVLCVPRRRYRLRLLA
jgi:5'-methylthioadenosine phosphorylase